MSLCATPINNTRKAGRNYKQLAVTELIPRDFAFNRITDVIIQRVHWNYCITARDYSLYRLLYGRRLYGSEET